MLPLSPRSSRVAARSAFVAPAPVAAPRSSPIVPAPAVPTRAAAYGDNPHQEGLKWPIPGLNGVVHTVEVTAGNISVDGMSWKEFKSHRSRKAAYGRFKDLRHNFNIAGGVNKRLAPSKALDEAIGGGDVLGHCEFSFRGQLVTTSPDNILINGRGPGTFGRAFNDEEFSAHCMVEHARRHARIKARGTVLLDVTAARRVYNVHNQAINKRQMTDAEATDCHNREKAHSSSPGTAALLRRAIPHLALMPDL